MRLIQAIRDRIQERRAARDYRELMTPSAQTIARAKQIANRNRKATTPITQTDQPVTTEEKS